MSGSCESYRPVHKALHLISQNRNSALNLDTERPANTELDDTYRPNVDCKLYIFIYKEHLLVWAPGQIPGIENIAIILQILGSIVNDN